MEARRNAAFRWILNRSFPRSIALLKQTLQSSWRRRPMYFTNEYLYVGIFLAWQYLVTRL